MTREEASYILRKFYADGYKSNDCNTLEQALQLAVMCLENFPRWISVEDELPKENGRYLFYHDKIGVQLAYYYNDLSLDKAVTHWMPMPQAPHHFIDANKKVDRVIGTADHIKTALDVLNKKGGE